MRLTTIIYAAAIAIIISGFIDISLWFYEGFMVPSWAAGTFFVSAGFLFMLLLYFRHQL